MPLPTPQMIALDIHSAFAFAQTTERHIQYSKSITASDAGCNGRCSFHLVNADFAQIVPKTAPSQ
jgi:hypothetical protein